MYSRFLRITLVVTFIAVLVVVIAAARGYRFDFRSQTITSTGILATSSTPSAAKVYVDGELKGVTDLNLTLPPGTYHLEMKKDGYTSWEKTIALKGEIVMVANALLFPKNPSLSPLTNNGVIRAVNLDQTGTILLFINDETEEKSGLYLFEADQGTLSFTSRLKPILLSPSSPVPLDLALIRPYFSPDYSEAIIELPVEGEIRSFLISLEKENTPSDIVETTASRDTFLARWEEKRAEDIRKILETFPDAFTNIASEAARLIAFSPDDTKIIYEATAPASLELIIDPALIGANQTPEERTLEKGRVYVYDKKEDKNIRLDIPLRATDSETELKNNEADTLPSYPPLPERYQELFAEHSLQWYPDSRHIGFMRENTIVIADYDGSNERTVYSGPFQDQYFLITSDGSLLILTNLNPQNNEHPDIYEVGIR